MAPQDLARSLALLRTRADGTSTDSGSVGSGKGNWRQHAKPEDFILEGWSEGFMVGALIIMACITIANMRRKVLLHKLILLEQLLAMSHGTFAFMAFDGYGWYLSSTATLLYGSWVIHNVVAWIEDSSFLLRPKVSLQAVYRKVGADHLSIYFGMLDPAYYPPNCQQFSLLQQY